MFRYASCFFINHLEGNTYKSHLIRAFGYSSEDVQMVIESMASQGKEPTFCMGDDIPLAGLSQRPHMLYDYFKQRFAQVHMALFSNIFFLSNFDPKLKHMSWFQVTNPAIDPLREGLVMSLEVNIGKRGNILELGPENASQVLTLLITSPLFYPILFHTISTYVLVLFFMNQVILSNPVLNEGALEELMKDTYLKPKVLSTYFDIRKGVEGSLQKALYSLCEAADDAVRSGSQLLVLSDRSDSLVKCLKVSSQKISLCQSKSAPSYIKISGNFALSGTNPPCNSDNVSCWRCPSTSYSERFEDVSFHCC